MTKANNVKQLKSQREKANWGSLEKKKIDLIYKHAGKSILDVGCGDGTYIEYLNKHGYDAYGTDLLSYNKWSVIDKTRFKIADVYKLPYKDKTFDTVLFFEVLEHLEHPELALKELQRISKKNIILSVPNCDLDQIFSGSGFTFYHYIDRTHINFFTENSIKELLINNKLKIDYLKLINPVMPETFLLTSLYVPLSLAKIIGKGVQRIPINKKYNTDIIIVTSEKKDYAQR